MSAALQLISTIAWILKKSCTDTLLGQAKEKEGLIFYDFQGHQGQALSAIYLQNQWPDFGQTGTETLFGGLKEMIVFLWPWPNFQGHQDHITEKASALYLLNQWRDFDQTDSVKSLGGP